MRPGGPFVLRTGVWYYHLMPGVVHDNELKSACILARESGMSYREIGQHFDVDHSLVWDWCNGNCAPPSLEKTNFERAKLDEKLEAVLHKVLNRAHEDDIIATARYSDLALMIKSGVPAMRLLRNESTANLAVASEEERDNRLIELMQRAQARKEQGSIAYVSVESEQVETPPGGEGE